MTKYIIKNCPSFWGINICGKTFKLDSYAKVTSWCYCQGITDCLLKQIVEKCKFHSKICKDCGCDVCFECEHLTGGRLANKILSMLDIEECE